MLGSVTGLTSHPQPMTMTAKYGRPSKLPHYRSQPVFSPPGLSRCFLIGFSLRRLLLLGQGFHQLFHLNLKVAIVI